MYVLFWFLYCTFLARINKDIIIIFIIIIIVIITNFASNGFRTDNRSLISITSNSIPPSNSPAICLRHHFVNFFFIDALNEILKVRSRGWNRFVILAGTWTKRKEFSRKSSFACPIIYLLKTSRISNAYWSFPFHIRLRNDYIFEKLQEFCSIAEMVGVYTKTEWVQKVEFMKNSGSLFTLD